MFTKIGSEEQVRLWDGLQSYWKFDETSGTIAVDSIGGANGTLSNADAHDANGKNGYGMHFTYSRFCSYGTPFLWTKAQPYSISAWVKAPSNPTPVIPILSNLDSSTSASIDLYINVGNIYFALMYNNTSGRCFKTSTTLPISDTNWHHVCCTYNGNGHPTGMVIYVDGVLQDNTTTTDTLNYTGTIGGVLNTNRRYTTSYDNGAIVDEICLWNRELSEVEAKMLYSAGNGKFYGTYKYNWEGLTTYLNLNETSGTNVNDSLDNLDGTATSVTWNSGGKNSYCARFGGNGSIVSTNNTTYGSQGTMNFWLKLDGTTSQQIVDGATNYGDSQALEKGINIQLYGSKIYFKLNSDSAFTYDPTAFGTNTWKMVTVVWNGTSRKLYINGILAASNTVTLVTPTNGKLILGVRCDGFYYTTGYMDELSIFNNELSLYTILKLYNSGNGKFYPN